MSPDESSLHPKVDILVPVRAPAPWFTEALESVVRQDYPNWRLIVVMDGYAQEIEQSCHNLQISDRLILEEMPAGTGLVGALNRGLAVSDASYLARLDADDVCRSDRLSKQVAYMQNNPECVVVGGQVQRVSEAGEPLGPPSRSGARPVMKTLRWRCPIAHPTAMIRSRYARQVGGYRPEALHAEDFDLWLRMGATGTIDVISDVVLDYRVHTGQVTAGLRFPSTTLEAIKDSRLQLAQARNESLLSARIRQRAWVSVNRWRGR